MSRWLKIGRPLPPIDGAPSELPDWKQANPRRIERALERALGRPHGGWLAIDASYRIGETPRAYRIDGRDVVAWRTRERVLVAPDLCPHMGAALAGARTCDGRIVCPWHGLELGPEGHGAWRPYESHDDGVLVWVRFESDAAVPRPILAPRPERFIAGVIRKEATCEPADVIANRLDPWHGVHFHPYSFATLRVTGADDDVLALRVSYKIAGPIVMEVDVTFHSPEPRTIVMTIVGGDGAGSVVETHATPIDPARTAVVEATLATSDRAGFRYASAAGRLIRPFIELAAARLWVDDAAYAERLHYLREAGKRDGRRLRVVSGS